MRKSHLQDFKTSYVEVYQSHKQHESEVKKNFKTSYVEVYRATWKYNHPEDGDFKTSYVEVYLLFGLSSFFKASISKHLMLKFIIDIECCLRIQISFQNILC